MTSKPTLGRLIGSGKEAEVFEHGQAVLKLYRSNIPKRSAFREAATLAIVEAFEVPAPRAIGVRQVGERWGVLMTRAEGQRFADALNLRPTMMPDYMREMARLQLACHRHMAVLLPSLKLRLRENIRKATVLGTARQSALLKRLVEMPDGDRLCHGDFHPFNILETSGKVSIVDWLDAARGEPAADVCRSYVLMRSFDTTWASTYVDAYATESGVSRDAILAWLPIVAGARMAEDVPAEADTLMAMVDGA